MNPRLVFNLQDRKKLSTQLDGFAALAGLFRIVYVSTAQTGLTDSDIEALINSAQSNNHERFITGYLVHNGANFMQLIEGPFNEVDEIYGRILRDRRHSGIVRIQAEQAEHRVFPNWSMNYFRVDRPGSVGAMVSRGADCVDSLMDAGVPRDLLHLFSKFIQQTEYPEPRPERAVPAAKTRQDQQQDPQA
ncbi:MAG: BLUF domain-containing protein [Hyphomonas sp.]